MAIDSLSFLPNWWTLQIVIIYFVALTSNLGSTAQASKRWKNSKFQSHEKSCLTNCHHKFGKRLLFQGIEFLLTGFSSQKERDIEQKIWKHGGIVLSDIPSPNSRGERSLRSNGYQLPIILCSKKVSFLLFFLLFLINLNFKLSYDVSEYGPNQDGWLMS